MNIRVTTPCGLIPVILLTICLNWVSALTSPDDSQIDLYRVSVKSRNDADLLQNSKVDVFFRISDGYLVLASEFGRSRLSAAGLTFDRIAADVDRRQLALDIRHDASNVGKYPTIFQESGLRIVRVDQADLIGAKGTGLAPILTENIPVFFDSPPRLDRSVDIPPDLLDSLLSRIEEDSLLLYTEYLQSCGNRHVGTYGNYTSAWWLRDKFIDFGYDSVFFDTFTEDIDGSLETCRNVIACKVGVENPYHHIIIGAHRDAGEDSPGADDNGSGTAGVLEIARALRDIDTKYTFVFVLFDAEEQGMYGSWYYAGEAAQRDDRIVFMLNMDMIGHYQNDGDANIYYYRENDIFGLLWAALADSIPSIAITAHLTAIEGGGGSDHAPFMQYGYDAMFIHEYVFSTVYHTARDSTTYMNFDYLTRMVKASAATVYAIDRQIVPDRELWISLLTLPPEIVIPYTATPFTVYIREYGGAGLIPGSAQLRYSIEGGDTVSVVMDNIGGDLYSADLPPLPCLYELSYHVRAGDDSLGDVFLPSTGEMFMTVAATGKNTTFEDDFGQDQGWTVTGDASSGNWIRIEASVFPAIDYDGNDVCYITGVLSYDDVDDGMTILTSPAIVTFSGNAWVHYARYYRSGFGSEPRTDVFTVEISGDDGASWVPVETVGPVEQSSGEWYTNFFRIQDHIPASDFIRLRFIASDYDEDSFVRAAVDAVKFVTYATDLQVATTDVPNWTAGHPMTIQLLAALCEGTASWSDRFDQLDGTGLSLSAEGILDGIPTRVGPVVFTAQITDEFGGYDEQRLSFIIYDSLRITTVAIPTAVIDDTYECQFRLTGGTGDKSWSDRDGDLAGSGISLTTNGLLSGTPTEGGDIPFIAQVTDQVGATAEKPFTLHIIGPYICGDANADQTVNVADAVYIINYVFKSGQTPLPIEAGDANCDAAVNVGDAVFLINYVFKSGPGPCCP